MFCSPKQLPVVEKVNEYETNLDGFLPHIVVEQETGVPKSNRYKSCMHQNHSVIMG